jgi:hypothetical protein
MREYYQQLLDLVSEYETRFPGVEYAKGGSRVQTAANIVAAGGVKKIGADSWYVSGHTATLDANTCDCKDYEFVAPRTRERGTLCVHRLAIMIDREIDAMRSPRLMNLMYKIMQYQEAHIVMYRGYQSTKTREVAIITGYWVPGNSTPIGLTADEQVEVSPVAFDWALSKIGWVLRDVPEKGTRNFSYTYEIAPKSSVTHWVESTREIFYHRGMTEAMRLRRVEYDELAKLLVEDPEAMMDGPLPLFHNNFVPFPIMNRAKKAIKKDALESQIVRALRKIGAESEEPVTTKHRRSGVKAKVSDIPAEVKPKKDKKSPIRVKQSQVLAQEDMIPF